MQAQCIVTVIDVAMISNLYTGNIDRHKELDRYRDWLHYMDVSDHMMFCNFNEIVLIKSMQMVFNMFT